MNLHRDILQEAYMIQSMDEGGRPETESFSIARLYLIYTPPQFSQSSPTSMAQVTQGVQKVAGLNNQTLI